MVRGNRIKEFRFSPQTISANGTVNDVYTDHVINGEVLGVEWSFNRTGSITLSVSGTGFTVFQRVAPSGTGWQSSQPRVFSQGVTGSIAGAEHVPFVVNEPLRLLTGSSASGTQALSVVVKYR